MHQTLASLSLDLDNKWTYLKTHGEPGWESFPSYFDLVVPRFLNVLGDLGLKITVFMVGQDAVLERNRAALTSIAAAGHEIGNHSFEHTPWLHLYTVQELEKELSAAEDALEGVTGVRPIGFRGPGYSCSPAVLMSLARRGYQYDASTLPTFLGPLARTYYFLTARLTPEERAKRKRLFGGWSEGLRPVRPYWWSWDAAPGGSGAQPRLLEIPVTTMPLFRTPIHVSYLLFIRQFSALAAWAYWRLAMTICRLTATAPSLLLHPLDFLGANDDPDLAFFPAMRLEAAEKIAFVREVLADFAGRYRVVPLGVHAAAIARQDKLPIHHLAAAPETADLVLAEEAVRP
jgi:peptidoglycan-N-acetylglucosamine deacetylase